MEQEQTFRTSHNITGIPAFVINGQKAWFGKQNPEMMQNLMKSMSNMMNQPDTAGPSQPQQQDNNGRREMKGPSMNMGNLFPGMGPPPPMPTNSNADFEIPESVLSDSGSESSGDIRNVSYTAGGTKRRGRKSAQIVSDDANTIVI